VRLTQHGDRRGTAGLVGARPSDDVVGVHGDLPGRRRAPLDLGNDVEARRGERLRQSAGGGRAGDAAGEHLWIKRIEDGFEIREPTGCDLADDTLPLSGGHGS
jgi:hypothetical protein